MRICIFAILIAACTSTDGMRDLARVTENDVAQYQESLRRRLERLNTSYRQDSARQLETLSDLLVEQRAQEKSRDHQVLADTMLANWTKETLPSEILASFESLLTKQRERIDRAEEKLAASRMAYAAAYKDAQLDVARLDKVRANLRVLSQKEDTRKAIAAFVTTVGRVYAEMEREAREKAEQTEEGGSGS
jgi:hypothetical protein